MVNYEEDLGFPLARSFNCYGVQVTLPGTFGDFPDSSGQDYIAGNDDYVEIRTPDLDTLEIGEFDFTLQATEISGGGRQANRTFPVSIEASPFDIAFVLDRSGSMGTPTPDDITRWQALKNSVNGFIPFIESIAGTSTSNRFGLTLFASEVLSNEPFDNALTTINENTDVGSNVRTLLNDQEPSGTTAMGCGLKARIPSDMDVPEECGENAINAEKMTDSERNRVVVLFSDGRQNREPRVNLDGETYSDGSNIHLIPPADEGSIKIVTVGIDVPSGDFLTTLQALATTENGGTYISTADGCQFDPSDPDPESDDPDLCADDIEAAFDFAIAPALSNNSPQVVDARRGTVSVTPLTLPAFELNQGLKQLMIKVSFNREFRRGQWEQQLLSGIRVIKDGTDITDDYFEPIFVDDPTRTVILKTNFKAIGNIVLESAESGSTTIPSAGSYAIQLTKPTSIQEDLDYRVISYADDSRLGINWQVTPATPRVNQTLSPIVNLSWGGEPLTGATVEASVLGPNSDKGDLLARNPLKVDPSSAPDAGSPGYQKYLQLKQNDPEFLRQLAFNRNQLTLTDQGDGRYTGNINLGESSGIHQIAYRIHVEDPDSDSIIQRFALQSIYTRFGDIDIDASSVDTRVDGRTTIIDWRPITTDGLFIGPDQGSGFSVDGDDISLNNVTDNQDGSYRLVLTGNPNTPISFKVLDEEIYRGPAGQFGRSTQVRLWFIILLIVLVLLLLIILLWWLRRNQTETESGES